MGIKKKTFVYALFGTLGILATVAIVAATLVGTIVVNALPQDMYDSVHNEEWRSLNVNRMEFQSEVDFQRAEAQLREREKEDAWDPRVPFLLGSLYETVGEYNLAKEHFEKSLELAESSDWNTQIYAHFVNDSHAELALINYYTDNEPEALAHAKQVRSTGYHQNAELVRALENVLEEPERGDFRLELGVELRRVIQLQQARKEFELAKSLSVDPVIREQATSYLEVKMPKDKVSVSPKTRYYTLAGALSETTYQDYESAADFYLKAVQEDPEFDWAYSQLGIVYHLNQDYKKAMSHSRKAIELNPRSMSPHLTMGDVEIDQENYEKAIAHYQKALELGESFLSTQDTELLANVENQLGYAYEQLGKNQQAKRHYRTAMGLAVETSMDYQYAEEALSRIQ